MTCAKNLSQHPISANHRKPAPPERRTDRPWGGTFRPPSMFLAGTEGEILTPRDVAVLGTDAVQLWRSLLAARGTWRDVEDMSQWKDYIVTFGHKPHDAPEMWIKWTGGYAKLFSELEDRKALRALNRLADAGLVFKRSTRICTASEGPAPLVTSRSGMPKVGKPAYAAKWRTELEVRVHGAIGTYRGVEYLWAPTGVSAWCRTHGRGGVRNGANGRPPNEGNEKLDADHREEIARIYQTGRATQAELAALYGTSPMQVSRIVRAFNQTKRGIQNPTQPDIATRNQAVTKPKSASSSLTLTTLTSSSPSEKKAVPGTAAPSASPGTAAEQHLAKLQACRQEEARLRANPPTRDGKPCPVPDAVLWQVVGRQLLRDPAAYVALRAAELAAGYASPLARYDEALPPFARA